MKRILSFVLTLLMVITFAPFVFAQGYEPSPVSVTGSADALTTTVTVDGNAYSLTTYNIYNNYFFKLRDLAAVLHGTDKAFSVRWDGARKAVCLEMGGIYELTGTELSGTTSENKIFTRSGAAFYVDGAETMLTTYLIDNEHYVKFYDFSRVIDFQADWNAAANSLTADTHKPYTGLVGADIPIDYSNNSSWLLLPENTDKAVDCFYLVPTCWSKTNPNEPNFCEIDNPSFLSGAKGAFNNAGIVFSESCNIFVPYYRQLDAAVRVDMSIGEQDALMAELPVKDAIAAFDYYIKNLNNGRPFIIAGHSQGSDVCRYLLADYMKEHPGVYERMVAAYPIGCAITTDYLNENPHLKFAESADDTGVIISYNTETTGYNLPNLVVRENTLAINPISWTRAETPAVSSLSSRLKEGGASATGEYKDVAGTANATVNLERGVVNISGLDLGKYAPGFLLFPPGNLHGLDYPLFFYDIQKNIANRIEKYYKKSGGTAYTPVDYAQKNNWAVIPEQIVKDADVFYLYPTAWSKPEGSTVKYAYINDPSMMETVKVIVDAQATAYTEAANLFSPYYRSCDALEALTASPEYKDKLLLDVPVKDVIAAFDYYIKNLNDGRPFILAGHSQGANLLLYLLSDYMREHPDVKKRMVAAYVIGYSVTESYLADNPHLKFAEDRADTGVIISYNTEAPDIQTPNPVVEPGALVINPITWTRGMGYAGKELSLGSRIDDGTGKLVKMEHYADARIDKKRGTLICASISPDKETSNALFGKGNYHGLDYQLYYYDIEQNAIDRVNAFLDKP